MKKADLERKIEQLEEALAAKSVKAKASWEWGVEYKNRFHEAYDLLKKLPGCSSHPLWLEIQAFLGQFEEVPHPTYRIVARRK